jgi:AbrB family looped-hinge helix DNA binding protein
MEQAVRSRISEKGRLVIPISFREALGIDIGDEVDLRIVDNELRISTRRSRIQQVQQRLKQYAKPGRLMSDELIAERRKEAKRE